MFFWVMSPCSLIVPTSGAELATYMGEEECIQGFSRKKPAGKRPLGRSRYG
jgi:hypothetical protein